MKTTNPRGVFLICAVVCAGGAMLAAGCDNRHVLGAVDDADGGSPGGNPDGGVLLPDGAMPNPDGDPVDQDGRPVIDAPVVQDGAVVSQDAPVVNPDGAVVNPDGAGPNRDGAAVNPDGAVVVPTESWTGYVENYTFPSGSDVIKIAFASDGAGGLVGTMTLGSGTPPPPATDPNVVYPADLLSRRIAAPGPTVTTVGRYYMAEGFGYPMRGATRAGDRLRASMDSHDLWRGWCALQTLALPKPTGQAGSCLPNWDSMVSADGMTCSLRDPLTAQSQAVDCGRMALCSLTWGVCACDASACWAKDGGTQMTLDINITGDRAHGSLTGAGNVHFTKDP